MSESTPSAPEPLRSHRSRSLIAKPLLIMVWMGMLCGGFGSAFWMLDLASHFVVQYFVVCLVCSIWCCMRQQWTWFALAAATMLLLMVRLAPFYWADASQPDFSAGIRLVTFNLSKSNPHKQEVVRFLEDSQADIILLFELDRAWEMELRGLQARYAFRRVDSREDNFGIMLLTRLPVFSFEWQHFDDAGLPSATAVVAWSDRRVRIIGTHPLPPISRSHAKLRDQHLERLADDVQQSELPHVVCGDLNCSSWSVHFQQLIAGSGLRDSRLGRGIQASWPTFVAIARIPIDHVLMSPEIQIVERKLGPDLGSDHLPVIVHMTLANES